MTEFQDRAPTQDCHRVRPQVWRFALHSRHMRTLLCLTILASFSAAGEEILTDPPKSARANDLHKKAKKIWKVIEPLYTKLDAGEKVELAEITAAWS